MSANYDNISLLFEYEYTKQLVERTHQNFLDIFRFLRRIW